MITHPNKLQVVSFNRPCLGAADRRCPHNALTEHASSRCPDCRRRHWAQLRATTRKGNNPRKWRKLRAQVLADEPLCHWGCGRPSTQADHIIPVAVRPDLEYSRTNLVGSCATCNSSRGARPAPDF